jgi:glycosyltransferase involved in cell wall biosynthesis
VTERPVVSPVEEARRRLKVALVLDRLDRGGAERVLVTLANQLDAYGMEVHVIETRTAGPLGGSLAHGVRRHALGRRGRADVGALQRMAHLLDDEEIDIVHSHSHSASYFVRVCRLFGGRRWAHVVHDHHGPIEESVGLRWLDRALLRNVDAYLGVSPRLVTYAMESIGIPRKRCEYVPNAVTVPSAPLKKRGASFTVVQVARLVPEKDHPTALRAAALLRGRVPGLRWKFIGRADFDTSAYARKCRTLIAELGLHDTIEFVGELGELGGELDAADAAVLTSRIEGLPMALLETMARGLPVVVTDVGACARVVSESGGGIVVPVGDARAVAQALGAIARDPALGLAEGRRGRQFVLENHSPERQARQVVAAYLRLRRFEGELHD